MNSKKIVFAMLALSVWIIPAPKVAAAPEPVWKLSANTLPTNFASGAKGTNLGGPLLLLVATNVGGATTSGPITLEATLPAGVIPLKEKVEEKVSEPIGETGDPATPTPVCSILAQTVTCTTAGPLHPGRWLGASIPVQVVASTSATATAGVSGGGAQPVAITAPIPISPEPAPFDFLSGAAGFDAPLTVSDGLAATKAGSHPDQLTVSLSFSVGKVTNILLGSESPRDNAVDLPRGTIANPTATPLRCTEPQLIGLENPGAAGIGCPNGSQVGTVTIMTSIGGGPKPVISGLSNMVASSGVPADLGFEALGIGVYVHAIGGVRSDDDYGLFATIKDIIARSVNPILGAQAQLWGDPSSDSHDQIRGECLFSGDSCGVDPQSTAFLTLPTECAGSQITSKASVNSWENPGVVHKTSYGSAGLDGVPVSIEGCNQLEFEPTIEAEPTTNLADSPSGLRFNLHQPQNFDLGGRSTAALKDATVTLPEGMTVNPSQANGLEACSTDQIGLSTPIGETPIHFDKAPVGCPDAAKLGKVEVSTPLLENPLPDDEGLGAVYLAKPFDNPFGSLLAIYIVVDDPNTGTVAKLAGEVKADPVTGQLSATFEENPQLPLEDIAVDFFGGSRGSLRTPPACDTYTTTADFTPWSSPEGVDAHPDDSFAITAMPGGGDCPTTADGAPHSPGFSAGTVAPQAGAYSPFILKLSREDGSQALTKFEATLPPGLAAKFAGIPSCSEAEIAVAQGRSEPNQGAEEKSNPSCPAASQVGSVDVAAGAGITPLHVQGSVYLAGPYKGAPLSVVAITPAVAGPFDLGVVAVRAALYVDPVTAQGHAVSDPFPTILHGIPVDLRSATVSMDRPQFTLNPTSCDPMSIDAIATSILGQLASLSNRFQVGGCQGLPFKPRLSLRLFGGTKRGAHPRLRVVLRAKPGEANIARTTLALPRSEFLDQAHIRTVCTRVQFAADQCPQRSIYGHVTAKTPLLDETLEGPIYLRSSDNELPDTVGVLKGPASRPVEIEGVARIDSIRGGIRANLETIPDAPISKVVITMQGGQKGLLINSRNLCASTNRATVKMDGHNGKAHDFRPVVNNSCGKSRKARSSVHRKK